jgi:hypothetical protein
MNYDLNNCQQFSFVTLLISDTCKHTKNKSWRRSRLYFRGRMQYWRIFDFKQIIDVRPRTCLRFGFTLRFPSVVVAFLTFSFLFHPASYYFLFCTAVKSIKKQQLVEIRTMANPPAVVKLALESICLLLGENASDWKSIRAVIMRDNFINTVVNNFNTEDIRYACA